MLPLKKNNPHDQIYFLCCKMKVLQGRGFPERTHINTHSDLNEVIIGCFKQAYE